MGKIYLISDLHLNHNKEFIYAARGYESIKEMNEDMIANIRNQLTDNDELYILGDIILGEFYAVAELLVQIPGHVKYIIGNHDTDRRMDLYDELGWECYGYANMLKVGKWRFYLSHYPTLVANYDDGEKHLPMINLFGHTHQKNNFFNDNPYMYHVGVDSHGCKAVSIDEIKTHIQEKCMEIREL